MSCQSSFTSGQCHVVKRFFKKKLKKKFLNNPIIDKEYTSHIFSSQKKAKFTIHFMYAIANALGRYSKPIFLLC